MLAGEGVVEGERGKVSGVPGGIPHLYTPPMGHCNVPGEEDINLKERECGLILIL